MKTTDLTTVDVALDSQDHKMLTSIGDFKAAIVDFLKLKSVQLNHLDTKEVKDLVSIVSTIETSITKPEDSNQNVNVIIQNLINKFDDDI